MESPEEYGFNDTLKEHVEVDPLSISPAVLIHSDSF